MGYISKVLYVFILSLIPSFEGRYAVIVGAVLGLDIITNFVACSSAVTLLSLILPSLLPYIDKVMYILSRRYEGNLIGIMGLKYVEYIGIIRARVKPYVEKYGTIGLTIFVAIPLPGTGVWTGSIAAFILGMRKSKSIPALILGGITSIIITSIPLYTIRPQL